tara:strand:+ start:3960 stop:4679 length:720 start_codon:yes stop_codon:yes gene_type:complete
LFASIINQNPSIACTGNSITLEILKVLELLKFSDTFKNYPDHKSLDNVLDMVYSHFYKHWPQGTVIDRGPALSLGNFNLLKKHLNQPIQCIILWRDLTDVLASYIKWFENEPTAFLNKDFNTIEEKVNELMHPEGGIVKTLKSIENALKEKEKYLFIRYEDLVNNTETIMKQVYVYLQMPYYPHRYHSLSQFNLNGIKYDDTIVGNNLHTIRPNISIELNEYKKMIPESIIKKYGHIKL